MGIFSFFSNIKTKFEVETVLHTLLKEQIIESPALLAKLCAKKAWEAHPDLFNGKLGDKPASIVIAAFGLASVVTSTEREHPGFGAILIALGNILNVILLYTPQHQLTNIDIAVLEFPTEVYKEEIEAFNKKYEGVIETVRNMGID